LLCLQSCWTDLITFAGLRVRRQQQQQQQGDSSQLYQQVMQETSQLDTPLAPASGSAAVGVTAAADGNNVDGGRSRFTLAGQLSLLLSGLAGLSRQLTPQQQQQCCSWLLAVLAVSTPASA
jgi:hypothetical protein